MRKTKKTTTEKFWWNGNFPTKQAEIDHMFYLRYEKGMTNHQIGIACGRTDANVYAKIGRQPRDYTDNSIALRSENQRKKSEIRKQNVRMYKERKEKAQIAERVYMDAQKIATDAQRKADAAREQYEQLKMAL